MSLTKIINKFEVNVFSETTHFALSTFISGTIFLNQNPEKIFLGFLGQSFGEVNFKQLRPLEYVYEGYISSSIFKPEKICIKILLADKSEILDIFDFAPFSSVSLSDDELAYIEEHQTQPLKIPLTTLNEMSKLIAQIESGKSYHEAFTKLYGNDCIQNKVPEYLRSSYKVRNLTNDKLSKLQKNKMQFNFFKRDFKSIKKKICIVAVDLMGPIKNGGVGTFNTALAEFYASEGHEVTVLYTRGPVCENENFIYWKDYYKQLNIKLEPLFNSGTYSQQLNRLMSYNVYLWLKERFFDYVFFSEMEGPGYDCLNAKRNLFEFGETTLCVVGHSPNRWARFYNNSFLKTEIELVMDHMEKESLRLADLLITPSEYLHDWYLDQGWQLAENIVTIPSLLSSSLRCFQRPSSSDAFDEIVFLGRLEERKGLILFCDVIDELAKNNSLPPKITFVGKSMSVRGQDSQQYIETRSFEWTSEISIRSEFSQNEALSYLCEKPNCLVVMPSLSDNSPYTVVECIALKIPFLTSNVGGIPEIVRDKEVMFNPNVEEAKIAIHSALNTKPFLTDFLVTQEEVMNRWKSVLEFGDSKLKHSNPVLKANSFSFIINAMDFDLEHVWLTYDSVRTQSKNATVQIITSSPGLKVSLIKRGIPNDVIVFSKDSTGKALNQAAKKSVDDYLIFLDAGSRLDNTFLSKITACCKGNEPSVVSTFESLNASGQSNLKYPLSLCLGGGSALMLLENYSPLTYLICKRATFFSLGCFQESSSNLNIFREFYCRATIAECSNELVPDTLVHSINDNILRKEVVGISEAVFASKYSNDAWAGEILEVSKGFMKNLTINITGPESILDVKDIESAEFFASSSSIMDLNIKSGFLELFQSDPSFVEELEDAVRIDTTKNNFLSLPQVFLPECNFVGFYFEFRSNVVGEISVHSLPISKENSRNVIASKQVKYGNNSLILVLPNNLLKGIFGVSLPLGIIDLICVSIRPQEFSRKFAEGNFYKTKYVYRPSA